MGTNTISESGRVNDNGQLLMPMDRLNAWFKENKGKRIVVRFEASEPGSTDAQQGYYYGYILPTLVDAYLKLGERKRTDLLDNELVLAYPGNDEITHARYFTKSQMSDFLEWLKQFAAENLYVYIEDPRTL